MRPITRDDYPKCPRCDGLIPNNDTPGAYPGALSRVDNKTEICSDCGQREAMEQWVGQLMPMTEWHAARREFGRDVAEMQTGGR